MEEKDFSILGVGLLGFFFGIYDGKKMEEAKAFMGQWVYEHGGVDKKLNELWNLILYITKIACKG